jgi:hypothetical protein
LHLIVALHRDVELVVTDKHYFAAYIIQVRVRSWVRVQVWGLRDQTPPALRVVI